MLQKIGDKLQGQRWLAMSMLGILTLVFAAWGAYGIVDFTMGTGNYAAKVNGEEVSANEVNRAWQEEQPQYLRLFNGEISPAQRELLQNRLLDSFVRNAAVLQHATSLGYKVSDAQIRSAYESEPAFQVDGKFNAQAAIARLAQAGISPVAFDAEQRRSLLMNQLAGTVAGTDFLTPAEVARLAQLQDEQRELRFALLTPQQFGAGPAPEAAQVEAWYREHSAQYLTTESVKLAYAVLSATASAASLQVTEAQLRERYEKNKDRYVEPERRQARHILLTVDKDNGDAQVKAQAEALYQQATSGKDFAELAKAHSKDPGSAPQGGELGFADRTAYVPEFAAALFALKAGEVSKPVKTQYGYHLIQLEAIQPGTSQSFEQARADIEQLVRHELAADRFGEQQEQLQQRIERGSGAFEELVKSFGLTAGVVEAYNRGTGGGELVNNPALNDAVFSDKVLNQGQVGGPVPLGEDRLVVFHVLDHKPAAPKPLAEVREAVVAELIRQRGAEAAAKAADAALARLNAGESFDKVIGDLKLKSDAARFVGRTDAGLPVQVRGAVFAANRPAAGKPVSQRVKLDEGGVALVQVTGVRTAPAGDTEQLKAQRFQAELRRAGTQETDAYMAELVRTAKVKKNLKVFQ